MMKGEWKRSVKHVKQPRNPRRLVVKVGTSTLTRETGSLNLQNMEHLARVLADLEGMGYQPVLVSSGAIGIGTKKLRLGERPTELRMKQAAAAVGQCRMMHIYDKLFAEYVTLHDYFGRGANDIMKRLKAIKKEQASE